MAMREKLAAYAAHTDETLALLLERANMPALLKESMAYSLFAGGKRLRPALCMAACELLGGSADDALYPACAMELLHTYSLIHDDLPSMDNDDMRRGKPSNHIAFGEANAILAGDGLQALAFLTASLSGSSEATAQIARGALEMVMGQSIDLGSANEASCLNQLQDYKTCALFRAAVLSGAACAMGCAEEKASLSRFATAYGMLFQITDDILDVTGDACVLGKSVGKDAAEEKITFVSVHGADGARAFAEEYARSAHQALESFGEQAAFFHELIDYTLDRNA